MKIGPAIVASLCGITVLLIVAASLSDPCREPASAECRRLQAEQQRSARHAQEFEHAEREAERAEREAERAEARDAQAARAHAEQEARRESACVANDLGAKLCGTEASAYCDLMFDQLDPDDVESHQACRDLIPQRYSEWEAGYRSRRLAESETFGE